MLTINNIKVSDFYSIGDITLPINNGLHNVLGINKDINSEENSSNGSGKTSFFSAVYQGLFNKNTKNRGGLIASTNNSVTKKPYCIEVDLNVSGIPYTILNDRNKNKIKIFKEGVDISTNKIDTQLSMIKSIIGVDFDTFASLTYISQSNLTSILDLTNKDNILYQFFDISAIKQTEKALKEELKKLKEDYSLLNVILNQDTKSLLLLQNFVKEDMTSLHSDLATYSEELIQAESNPDFKKIPLLEQKIENVKSISNENNNKLSLLKYQITQTKEEIELYKSGKCPTCKQAVHYDVNYNGEEKLKTLLSKQIKIENDNIELKNTITDLQSKISTIKSTQSTQLQGIVDKINKIKAKISYTREQEIKYEYLEKEKNSLVENIKKNTLLLNETGDKMGIVEGALLLIKDGTLVNEYLLKFKRVFDIIIKDVSLKTNFNFKVKTVLSKGKIEYSFFDGTIEKQYLDLSAGEKTRVSLIVLISTLFALEKVAGIEINYLIIDELLGVLDEEGIELVKQLLLILKEKKAIYLITHHNEIESSFCDSEIIFEKQNGITKLIKVK